MKIRSYEVCTMDKCMYSVYKDYKVCFYHHMNPVEEVLK